MNLEVIKQKASIGSFDKTIHYDPTNPLDEKRAWMAAFNISSDRYDEIKMSAFKKKEELDTKHPYLKNLNWVNGEMYYIDDNGNRIETEVAIKEISASLEQSMRELLKSKIPEAQIETKIEMLHKLIDGKDLYEQSSSC
jgi:hypothetical protein